MAEVVLLTGAAGGMGRAIARAAVASGRRVVLVDRDGLSLEAFAAELGKAVCAIDVDVTDRARVDRLPELIPEPFEPIDVLINNAGHDIGGRTRFDLGSADDWSNNVHRDAPRRARRDGDPDHRDSTRPDSDGDHSGALSRRYSEGAGLF
jgi:NADP-dependent 3-hydroxy acid dehydrogenase YdfG